MALKVEKIINKEVIHLKPDKEGLYYSAKRGLSSIVVQRDQYSDEISVTIARKKRKTGISQINKTIINREIKEPVDIISRRLGVTIRVSQ